LHTRQEAMAWKDLRFVIFDLQFICFLYLVFFLFLLAPFPSPLAPCILNGETPFVLPKDSLGNMRVLDLMRKQIGASFT
jgi:hypothetical protein